MARWTASAKWAAGPALDGQRDMPLALRLSEGLGLSAKHIGMRNVSRHSWKLTSGINLVLLAAVDAHKPTTAKDVDHHACPA